LLLKPELVEKRNRLPAHGWGAQFIVAGLVSQTAPAAGTLCTGILFIGR